MLAELNLMLDMPVTLFLVLALGAAMGVGAEKLFSAIDRENRRAYWRERNAAKGLHRFRTPPSVVTMVPEKRDTTRVAADQLRTVMNADFKARPLLNKPERRLLACIDRVLLEDSPGWRAMGQVSLGEILSSHDREAFWAINAKRVDLLIIDVDCRPLHAVEFQGTGHHGSPETAARDAIKREALRRAGIGYVEVMSGDTPPEVREKIRKLISRGAEEIRSVSIVKQAG